MGGIARRATKINEVRNQGIPTIVVDGGDFAPRYSQQGAIRFESLLESFRQMEYDAIGIGRREILMQRDIYNAWEQLKASGVPMVTLNMKYRGKRLIDRPLIIHRDGVNVGLLSLVLEAHIPESAHQDWEIEDPEPIIDEALSWARQDADFVVAMLHGDLQQVRQFVKRHQGMDVVIVVHHSTAFAQLVKINNSVLLSAGSQGKYLGKIDALLSGKRWKFKSELIALDKTVPQDPQLSATYANYQERVKQLEQRRITILEKKLRGKFPPIPLVTACQSCHGDIFNRWLQTPHARAIFSLVEKNEHHNPECIVCHVTGYLKGGFLSVEKTPEYAGVQCASCHGRMEGHVEFHSGRSDRLEAPFKVTQQVCLQCHTPEQDDDFDFERDKKLVH